MTQTVDLYESSASPVLRRDITRIHRNFDYFQNNTLPFPSFTNDDSSVESNNSIENFELSNNIDTPYITDEIVFMMKNIGGDKKL